MIISGQNGIALHNRGQGRWGRMEPDGAGSSLGERETPKIHIQSCFGQFSDWLLYKLFLHHPYEFCTKLLVTEECSRNQ